MCTMHVAACTDKEASISLDLESQVGFELSSVGAENEIWILWKSSSPLQFFLILWSFIFVTKISYNYHYLLLQMHRNFQQEICWIWTQFCVIRTLPSSSVKTRTRPIQYFCVYYLVKEQAFKAPVNKLYEKWKNIHSLHLYIMYIRISRNTTDIFLLLTLIDCSLWSSHHAFWSTYLPCILVNTDIFILAN